MHLFLEPRELVLDSIAANSVRVCFRRPAQGRVLGYTIQYWRDVHTVDSSGLAPLTGVRQANLSRTESSTVCDTLTGLVEWEYYRTSVYAWGTSLRGPATDIVGFVPRRNGKKKMIHG